MKIKDVSCHVLLAPNYDPRLTSSAQDSFIVTVTTDEGITGIGEADVNPWIAKACIEAPGTHTMGLCIRDMLIGEDPLDSEGLWRKMYVGSCMNGRRGAVIHAMSAIDMALWDIRGKAAGKPVFEMLGGLRQQGVIPYASLQPGGDSFEEYRDSLVDWAHRAKELGFKAVKTEVTMSGPYAHSGLREPFERHTEIVAAVRQAVGPAMTLMVDVQYLWEDAATALETVRDWQEFDVFFLETPIWTDRLDEYAKLAEATPMRIAAGEWLATHWEFEELMDRGKVQVVQPDVGRVGGFTEAKRVCDMAAERGLQVVPHCWKTGVSVAATAHLAFNTPHCPFIEYLPPQLCLETLRKELAQDNLKFEDGVISPPDRPGLGIDLDWDVLQRYRVA
ncbi:MAG: mandelate racemase/muconate lactonizing enzyme family protein [Trueperaceae bacterium]